MENNPLLKQMQKMQMPNLSSKVPSTQTKLKIQDITSIYQYFNKDTKNLLLNNEALKSDLKQNSQTEPIIVSNNNDKYIIVDGEKRYKYLKELNIQDIKVTIVKMSDKDLQSWANTKTNENKFVDIELSKIKTNIIQSRCFFNKEELQVLQADIKENGLLEPIGLNYNTSTSEHQIMYGERRYLACKNLNHKTIKAVIYIDSTIEEKVAKELSENGNRKNLTGYEIMLNALKLHIIFGKGEVSSLLSNVYSQEKINEIQNSKKIFLEQNNQKPMSNIEIVRKFYFYINKSDEQKQKDYSKMLKIRSLAPRVQSHILHNHTELTIDNIAEIISVSKDDNELQWKAYEKLINGAKIAEIRELKKPTKQTTPAPAIKKTAKKISLSLNWSNLNEEKKDLLYQELENLKSKYNL